MDKTAIVYWSGTGNTEAMAGLVLEGVKSAGGQADVFTAGEFTPEKAKKYGAIAFGCPSMGVEQLEESEFEPMYAAVKPELGGKSVVLFGSYGWGDGEWMRNWEDDCSSSGCRLAADPVTANGAPDDEASKACVELGKALAQA